MSGFFVEIDDYLCKGCNICINKCPTKVFEPSTKVGGYGSFMPEVKNMDKCIGCNICVYFCPDFAIEVKKMEEVKGL